MRRTMPLSTLGAIGSGRARGSRSSIATRIHRATRNRALAHERRVLRKARSSCGVAHITRSLAVPREGTRRGVAPRCTFHDGGFAGQF
jgi:hypothetical protein